MLNAMVTQREWVLGQIALVRCPGGGCSGRMVMPGATRDIRKLVVRYQSKGKVCHRSGRRRTKGDFPYCPLPKETPDGICK